MVQNSHLCTFAMIRVYAQILVKMKTSEIRSFSAATIILEDITFKPPNLPFLAACSSLMNWSSSQKHCDNQLAHLSPLCPVFTHPLYAVMLSLSKLHSADTYNSARAKNHSARALVSRNRKPRIFKMLKRGDCSKIIGGSTKWRSGIFQLLIWMRIIGITTHFTISSWILYCKCICVLVILLRRRFFDLTVK